MFFTVKNKPYLNTEQLRVDALLNAYYIIENYPLKASEMLMDQFILQKYKMSLKDLCVKLLLNITFYENAEGDLILMFKNQEYDKIAQLITYGNGAVPGCKILQISLNDKGG